MKDYRFDELTKELAAKPVSRRRALRLLLAGAGAGLLSALTAPNAYAARPCRTLGQTCQSDAQCCSRYCDNSTFRCACPPGTQLCNGECVAECTGGHVLNTQNCKCECPSTLPKDCGDVCCASNTTCCGNTCCPSGTTCTNVGCCPNNRACGGECCPPGFTCSGGACVGQPAPAVCGTPCTSKSECAKAVGCPECKTAFPGAAFKVCSPTK